MTNCAVIGSTLIQYSTDKLDNIKRICECQRKPRMIALHGQPKYICKALSLNSNEVYYYDIPLCPAFPVHQSTVLQNGPQMSSDAIKILDHDPTASSNLRTSKSQQGSGLLPRYYIQVASYTGACRIGCIPNLDQENLGK